LGKIRAVDVFIPLATMKAKYYLRQKRIGLGLRLGPEDWLFATGFQEKNRP
jgi:hypothetical protein